MSENKKILIVDDCEHIGSAIAYYLKKANYTTITARSKEEVHKSIAEHKFCAIISDWHIEPDYNAENVIRDFKDKYSFIPHNIVITRDINIVKSEKVRNSGLHEDIIDKSDNAMPVILKWLESLNLD